MISYSWSEERIKEAKYFIKDILINKIKPETQFNVGYSGGKDSSILLQLVLESIEEIGDKDLLNRLIVSNLRTRYELKSNREHCDLQIKRLREMGIAVVQIETLWAESYGTATLGFGTISQVIKHRECNRMKATIARIANKLCSVSFNGTRSEESLKRKNDPRVSDYEGTFTARPIKNLLVDDVWGYLEHIGTTKWGMTYKELRNYYDTNNISRDGCWCCCFHKNTVGYTNAQRRVVEKLDLIRKTNPRSKEYIKNEGEGFRCNDYIGRTVDWPTGVLSDYDTLFTMIKFSRNVKRPWNVCQQALEIVEKIEIEENEIGEIIFPEEKILIKDLIGFRKKYGIVKVNPWMLNKELWCGRNLYPLHEFTIETFKGCNMLREISERCKGDWFGRLARERERLPLFRREEQRRGVKPFNSFEESLDDCKLARSVFESYYMEDEKYEPFYKFYRDGDPASKQEECKLEIIARSNK